MKTFGLLVPTGKGSKFERNVRDLLADRTELAAIALPLLEAWSSLRTQVAGLGTSLVATARQSTDCHLLMSIPGIGAATATSFAAAIEDPANFRNSRSVGARVGLTARRYQSGEVDYDGHISRRGDRHLRWLLYEAAAHPDPPPGQKQLADMGLRLRERIGFERAAVAVARKLAVIMHGDAQDRRGLRAASCSHALPSSGERSGPERLRRPCRDVGRAIPLMGLHRRRDRVRHPH